MKKDINQVQAENFLYNIGFLRRKLGISKKKMAELLCISVSTLNKIEQGIPPQRLFVELLLTVEEQFYIPAARLLVQKLDKQ